MKVKRLAWVAVLVFLALFLTSCGSKDLASVARLDKGDISVRDRFGNQVKVTNPDEFRKVLKEAKKIADPKDQGKTVETDYVVLNDLGMVYYDDDGKYLVYTDGSNKRQVYQGDLSSLISKLAGLPPKISTGKDLDSKISPSFAALSKTSQPWAVSFPSASKQVIMVTAGQVSSAGYVLEIEKAALGQDGTLALTVRLLPPPAGMVAVVVSYPYVEVAVETAAELDIRMVTASAGGEKVDHVPLTKATESQSIIPVRPERGALVLERLHVAGFVKALLGVASIEVEVEDGHNVLGKKTVTAPAAMPEWAYFETDLDIKPPTNPYGAVIYRATVGTTAEEVIVPISFSGK